MLAKVLLAYASASVALLCGPGLLWPQVVTTAARVLFVWSLLLFLSLRLPIAFIAPRDIGSWYEVCEMAVEVAGVWALYVRLADFRDRKRAAFFASETGLRAARVLFALSLVLFGAGHFVFPKGTASLVPTCLPWHTGLAVFTAYAFFAAALAILFGVFACLATALSAAQMGLFALLVYVPKVLHHTASSF